MEGLGVAEWSPAASKAYGGDAQPVLRHSKATPCCGRPTATDTRLRARFLPLVGVLAAAAAASAEAREAAAAASHC